jgi:DNA gyrase subunit A
MDVVDPTAYIWSITDNGLAKASPMDEYPVQGRYGQGVLNLKLPDGAKEVVTAVVVHENTEIIITTKIGSIKKIQLKKMASVGRRSLKPREVVNITERNQVTGAVRTVGRPEMAEEEEETAVVTQLTLLDSIKPGQSKRKRKAK